MIDPFDGRSEMTSEEFRAWIAQDAPGREQPAARHPESLPNQSLRSGHSAAFQGMRESAFRDVVVEVATRLGWLVYWTWNSKHSPKGFPDLCLVRRDRLIFAELKVGRNRLTQAQYRWLDWLSLVSWNARQCGFDNIGVYHWRPEQWSEIEEVLA